MREIKIGEIKSGTEKTGKEKIRSVEQRGHGAVDEGGSARHRQRARRSVADALYRSSGGMNQ